VAAAESCLRDGFRLDNKATPQGPVEACLRVDFGPASAKMPGRVWMTEISNCPPRGSRITFKPPTPPARVMLDFNNLHQEACIKVKRKVDTRCLVRGELNQEGRVANTSADCDDPRLEKTAESCAQAFKLKDPFKGASGEVCMTFTFTASPDHPTSKTFSSMFSASEHECGERLP